MRQLRQQMKLYWWLQDWGYVNTNPDNSDYNLPLKQNQMNSQHTAERPADYPHTLSVWLVMFLAHSLDVVGCSRTYCSMSFLGPTMQRSSHHMTIKQTPSTSYLRCPTCWARSSVCRSRSWPCSSQTPWEHNSEKRRPIWMWFDSTQSKTTWS